MINLKYNKDDIDRIFKKNVSVQYHDANIKKGLIAEWCFTYPNGNKTSNVESCFPMNEDNHNREIAVEILESRIKDSLWKIAGQYTLTTNEKL